MSRPVTVYRLDLVDDTGGYVRCYGYCADKKEGCQHAAESLHVPAAQIRATAERYPPMVTRKAA
jgi:hypothetical protein